MSTSRTSGGGARRPGGASRPQRGGPGPVQVTWAGKLGQLLVLLGFWLALSARLDPLFLGMGVASAALVTALTNDLAARHLGPPVGGLAGLGRRGRRLAVYAVWLVGRMVPAAVMVAYHVLHPRMPIAPGVLRFRSGLDSQVARAVLANSITLVPGTLTVAVEDDEFIVHVFVPQAGDDLLAGVVQRRVAWVFLQDLPDPPEVVWQARSGAPR